MKNKTAEMKKTIQWYEKRGKGSYNDPKLNHFVSNLQGFDDELQLAKEASYTPKQRWYDRGLQWLIKNFELK